MTLQSRITDFYHRWNTFERDQVLDMALVQPPADLCGEPFSSRKEVQEELGQLLEEVVLTPENQFANKRFLERKLRGSLAYVNALEGKRLPFSEYLWETMEIRPNRLCDEEREMLKEDLANSLAYFGVPFSREGRVAFQKKVVDPDKTKFAQELKKAAPLWVERVTSQLQLKVSPQFVIQFEEHDSYWINWLSGRAGEPFTLRINMHPSIEFSKGDGHFFAPHEIGGHAVHGASLMESARLGMVDPASLNITLHNPESFILEAIAQSVGELFLKDEDSFAPFLLRRTKFFALFLALTNEAQCMMEEDGVPLDQAVDFVLEHHPFQRESSVRRDLIERQSSPSMCVYQFIYYPSYRLLMQLSHVPYPERWKLLRDFYTKLWTPSQMEKMISERSDSSIR